MKHLFLVLTAICLLACSASKKANSVIESAECQSVVKTNEQPNDLNGAKISSVSIEGNCMIIEMEMGYSGVKAEAFELRWNGKMKKSMPPQVTLALHKAKGEESDTAKKYRLKYDLSILNSMGRSFITLKGWEERIEYNPNPKD